MKNHNFKVGDIVTPTSNVFAYVGIYANNHYKILSCNDNYLGFKNNALGYKEEVLNGSKPNWGYKEFKLYIKTILPLP